ncbi:MULTISPECIES: heavy-metal-associated domain-containing protein [unclassified Thermoactinomyces]|jgi:copper chaperone CopZ|uniref:heavy-metal-associated domain-containing protein n=1 Tax=unclassified Thermoactinomyces TaxID=2634588 RepID=UPI0018DD86AC|nr:MULTISPECIES: heavy-metal-associated domain-containing protein [unclassified Thermoactinomyces]MBH8599612.1 heavy-metal-associated domain-containing protein [Thermoactinomyces sp. CICC 10523]MBH8605725.1 heavy-metal-associated domain-containing protein [Thermoactinomyces sp. CICC 10522]MBH8609193.1 heavy-metal-associated domain-containing protein [Thermoactinomyces sp. CICC 10521]
MKKETIKIKGMKNKEDLEKVLAGLQDVWGVRQVDIDLSRGEAVLSFNEKSASLHDFKQAVINTGFQVEGEHENL